jgi:hypothetical protein
LEYGRVIFSGMEELWESCGQHWSAPDGIPGFGDWSSLLHDLDPFRDGRAAERMGTYVKWMIDGFKSGLDRENILAEAAERYSSLWGSDKVCEFSQDSGGNTPEVHALGSTTLRTPRPQKWDDREVSP